MFRYLFVFIVLCAIVLPFDTYAALSGNLTSWGSWRAQEGIEIHERTRTLVFEEGFFGTQYAYHDFSVAGYAGKYLVLGAFSWSEDRTSDPFIFGYVYDAQGKKVADLSNVPFFHGVGVGESWGVLSGIFALPPSASTVRLYVARARGGRDGEALVYKLDARGVGSSLEGRAFINDMYYERLFSFHDRDTQLFPDQRVTSFSCTESRYPLKIELDVDSAVYADDEDADLRSELWGLWAANEDAWLWENWGTGNALARSVDARAAGYLCGKRGDKIRVNGSFADGNGYLVSRGPDDELVINRITSLRIHEVMYEIGEGKACTWEGNGLGGYDMVCTIQ